MARCDEGYPCEVCGQHVEVITESDLYLRYVLGEIVMEKLHLQAERHIRCNPALAQYIVAEGWEPVHCEGMFDKRAFDPTYVAAEEQRRDPRLATLASIANLGFEHRGVSARLSVNNHRNSG